MCHWSMRTTTNPLTGLKRRRPPKNTSRRRRSLALCTAVPNVVEEIQKCLIVSSLCTSVLSHAPRREQLRNDPNFGEEADYGEIIQLMVSTHVSLCACVCCCHLFRVIDACAMDAPVKFSEHHPRERQKRLGRMQDFLDDDEMMICMTCGECELNRAIEMTGLPEWVHVPMPGGSFCRFHREELFMHMLWKFAGGEDNIRVSSAIGGEPNKDGCGCRHMTQCLHNRHEHLIGDHGMDRWVQQFPFFAEKI